MIPMGEVCVVSTLDRSNELNDTFREVAIDHIIKKLQELDTNQLLRMVGQLEVSGQVEW